LFDPVTFDPKMVLAEIAMDRCQPAVARVQAIRVWVSIDAGGPATRKERALQTLNERAIEMMLGSSPLVH
jgi:hypothetical protein